MTIIFRYLLYSSLYISNATLNESFFELISKEQQH